MKTTRHAPIRGLEAAQNIHIEEAFGHLIDHEFDMVIELGTKHGGFAVFLAERFRTVVTFDHKEYAETWMEFTRHRNIDFVQMDIFKNIEVIEVLIRVNDRVLLLCDNGNKKREVATFAPFLKPGDVIMAHDYARDREYFKKHIQGKYWNSLEIQDSDVKEVFEENGIEYYLQEEMEKAAWLCGMKK